MGGTKFLMRCISHLDIRNMLKKVKAIAIKAQRPYLITLADVVFCGLRYQAGYHDYQEFEFYKLNGRQRATYLTRGKNNMIIKKYNDKAYFQVFDDKGNFYQRFNQYLGRPWLDLRKSSLDDFKVFMAADPDIVVKPADGEGGHGVERIIIDAATDQPALYEKLLASGQNIVEKTIVQHPQMGRLYPDSVNSLRMFTFTDGQSAWLLQTIMKIGNGGVVDNFSSGGMYTFVDEAGQVVAPAVDRDDNIFHTHPVTGTQIEGFMVPFMAQASQLVCQAALTVPQIGYVGWDVAITADGPVIIEGNAYPGVFQIRPSFSHDKTGILPKYKKVMDI